jgi:tRNA threonylcarbamoyladenosine biosynthesis protein TsaE
MLADESETAALGARIATTLKTGDVVALSGELGAGKTTLARAILRALGVEGHVPSPTFTLMQAYDTRGLALYHFDLYRIEHESEMSELGLEDALIDGAALVEWPEKGLSPRLAADALFVALKPVGATAREVQIRGPERWRGVFGDAP